MKKILLLLTLLLCYAMYGQQIIFPPGGGGGGGLSLTNIYNDSKGWVGISNTTPQATLDVVGNIRSSTGISPGLTNTTLSGNVTLTPGISAQYQFLSDGGALRTICLSSAGKNGDSFFIRNTSDYSSTYYYEIRDVGQAVIIDYLFAGKGKWYVFYNSSWHAVDDYAYNDVNMSSGYNSKAINYGMSYGYLSEGATNGAAFGYQAKGNHSGAGFGYQANGSGYGAAFGRLADGSYYGAALGNSANGAFNGAAVGYGANGYNYGAAVGRYANGTNYGAAVGLYANGYNYGAAVGYGANGYNYGAAVGYQANGTNNGSAVGYSANGGNSSVAIGRSATYSRTDNAKTNIAIGYWAGFNNDVNAITNGSYNLLIGRETGVPNGYTSYYLNIGNAIFGTNVQTVTGTNIDANTKIGIATNDPHYTLEVHGDIGLGQNGNLYKGGEKLGWYSTGTFSQYGTTSITFPVTNAVYKIEGWGQAQSNDTNITASSAGIYYGASDTQDKIVNIRMASAAGGSSDQAKLPFYFADIVEVNLESERVNYWKIKASGGVGVTVSGYYILTRIR